jgi:hypothetical protein
LLLALAACGGDPPNRGQGDAGTDSGTDGSTSPAGWPGAQNTGYRNAPGYPGALQPYSPTPIAGNDCSGPITSGKTYSFCLFENGFRVGDASTHPTGVTFVGCRFTSNSLDDANVATHGDDIVFDYCSFEPSQSAAPPTPYSNGYQYGIDQRYDGKLTVDHSDFWGWGNAIQIGFSSQAKPLTIANSWFHDARDDGGIDHTDAILENYGGPGFSYMTFHHNTIVSVGNTNGLALQNGNDAGYDHTTVTENYFSGFGYTVNLGGGKTITNTVFTDNVWGTDLQQTYFNYYGPWTPNAANANTWRRNTVHYAAAGTRLQGDDPNGYVVQASDDGMYWVPTGDGIAATDYTGF